jgi:hypothetical protein
LMVPLAKRSTQRRLYRSRRRSSRERDENNCRTRTNAGFAAHPPRARPGPPRGGGYLPPTSLLSLKLDRVSLAGTPGSGRRVPRGRRCRRGRSGESALLRRQSRRRVRYPTERPPSLPPRCGPEGKPAAGGPCIPGAHGSTGKARRKAPGRLTSCSTPPRP